jgi:hypothetical protein
VTDAETASGPAARVLPRSLGQFRIEHAWMAATALAVVVRTVCVFRPLNQPSWREGDLIAMARGFARESLNPLAPRIAWRGTTSGVAESEFPLVPWLTGLAWRVTGEHPTMIRIVPFIAGLLTLLVFGRFAIEVLGKRAGWLAIAALAVNPLATYTAVSAQSDAVMMLGVVLAVSAAWRWQHQVGTVKARSGLTDQILVVIGLVLAGTMKLTGLHVGIVIAAIVVTKGGMRALLRRDVLAIGFISLAISAAWAAIAKANYNQTGLSLGISNEHHWAGLDLVREPGLIIGMIRHEVRYVWLLFGLVFAGLATVKRRSEPAVRLAITWLIAVAVMLLAAGRTTGDGWAFYYHLAAVPPAALLIGAGLDSGWTWSGRRARHMTSGTSSLVLVGLSSLVLLLALRTSLQLSRPQSDSPLFVCAQKFESAIGRDLIVTSGGPKRDSGGNPVAYDASYMFEWIDTTGWTIALEDQSVENVKSFESQGAKWFIAENDALSTLPAATRDELTSAFTLADTCDAARLFRLWPPS